jgi:hypothetical protein
MSAPRSDWSPGARRLARTLVAGSVIALVIFVVANVAMIAGSRRVEQELNARGIIFDEPSRTAVAAGPAGAVAPTVPVAPAPRVSTASPVSTAPDATGSGRDKSAPPVPSTASPSDLEAVARLVVGVPETMDDHLAGLARSRSDDGHRTPEAIAAWLSHETADIDLARRMIAETSDDDDLVALLTEVGGLVRPDARPAARFWRSAQRLAAIFDTRAVHDAEWGHVDGADITAVLHLHRVRRRWFRATIVGTYVVSSWDLAMLRRVRPPDAEWAAELEEVDALEAEIRSCVRYYLPPRPQRVDRTGWYTVDAVIEDLPAPARAAVAWGLITPGARWQWSRRARLIMEWEDRARASGNCIVDAAGDDVVAELDFCRNLSALSHADRILTHEVLRLALPELGLQPLPAPCKDWSLVAAEQSDGSTLVEVRGEVGRLNDHQPALAYVVPPR